MALRAERMIDHFPASDVNDYGGLNPDFYRRITAQRKAAAAEQHRLEVEETKRLEREARDTRAANRRIAVAEGRLNDLVLQISERLRTQDESDPYEKRQIFDIVKDVSARHGIPVREVLGNSRKRPVVLARQEVMYLARLETKHSLPVIGRHLGGRDHTTVLHGIRAYAKKAGLPLPGRSALDMERAG